MGADVDEGAAALLVLVEEHTPGRNGAPADGVGLGEIDVTERPGVHRFFHQQAVRTAAVLIPDGQLFAGLTGGVQHFLGVGGGLGHGLLAHHMLARLQRGHRDFTVGAVGGADMHHVDAAVLKQLPIVLVHLGPRRAKFLGRLFGRSTTMSQNATMSALSACDRRAGMCLPLAMPPQPMMPTRSFSM